jgi:hypothetical protein
MYKCAIPLTGIASSSVLGWGGGVNVGMRWGGDYWGEILRVMLVTDLVGWVRMLVAFRCVGWGKDEREYSAVED